MSIKKLNLTQIKVKQELAKMAKNHPSYTYRILLNNPQFRQDLLDYVLKKIIHQYSFIESSEDLYEFMKNIKCNTQERTQIYNLVDQRINDLRTKRTFHHPIVNNGWKSCTNSPRIKSYK